MDYSLRVYLILKETDTFPKGQKHFTFPQAICVRAPVSLHSLKHLVFSGFNFSCSSKCVVVFHCGLFCISLMKNNVEHILMYLFDILILFSVKWLFKSFAHFFTGMSIFYY